MTVQLFWCGTVRGYHRAFEDTYQVALYSRRGKLHSRIVESHIADPREAIASALRALLENPKGFPLHGIHWVPSSAGGTGPVLKDQPDQVPNWKEYVKEELQELAKLGWEV